MTESKSSWLGIQRGLLSCAVRMIAAVVTGNDVALDAVTDDVERLHRQWDRRSA